MSVIKVTIEILMVAILGGVAFTQFFAINTSTWSATTIATWGVIALVGIIAIVITLLKSAGINVNM